MFKLIVIAVVVVIAWKKLNTANKARITDKIDQLRSGNVNAPAAIDAVKERSRGLLIQVLVTLIGILTGLLKLVLGNQNGNLPVIRK